MSTQIPSIAKFQTTWMISSSTRNCRILVAIPQTSILQAGLTPANDQSGRSPVTGTVNRTTR